MVKPAEILCVSVCLDIANGSCSDGKNKIKQPACQNASSWVSVLGFCFVVFLVHAFVSVELFVWSCSKRVL